MTRSVVSVSAVDCDVVSASWPFAIERADDIDRHWRQRCIQTPELFNGEVLLLERGKVADENGSTVFRGACMEVEFKAFLAWRDFGFRPSEARNCFAMAALESSDGAFVLGEMGAHTASAGQVYFPSGTPDRHDIVGTKVDMEGSAARELREETGLAPEDLVFEPGMILVMDPVRVCCMKRVRSPDTAKTLVDRIHDCLSRESKPEFSRMHVVRTLDDVTPAMPAFIVAYLRHMFAAR